MNAKLAAGLCIAAAVVACIAVFLPWFSVNMSGFEDFSRMGVEIPSSQSFNGTKGEFHGVAILILCLLGGAGATIFAGGLDELVPLTGKQLLFLAATLFAVAAVLAFIDVTKDYGQGMSMMGKTMQAGKDFGIYLTLVAVLSATTFAAVAAARAEGD